MTELTGGPVVWSTKDQPGPKEWDLQSVALHEWGHLLGLVGHCGEYGNPACVPDMVMGSLSAGKRRRDLSGADIAWIRMVYP